MTPKGHNAHVRASDRGQPAGKVDCFAVQYEFRKGNSTAELQGAGPAGALFLGKGAAPTSWRIRCTTRAKGRVISAVIRKKNDSRKKRERGGGKEMGFPRGKSLAVTRSSREVGQYNNFLFV